MCLVAWKHGGKSFDVRPTLPGTSQSVVAATDTRFFPKSSARTRLADVDHYQSRDCLRSGASSEMVQAKTPLSQTPGGTGLS